MLVETRFIRATSEASPTDGGDPRHRKRDLLRVDTPRTERPQDYLKIIASVMPKRMEAEDVGPPCRAADLSDDELAAIIAGAKLTVIR